jgi:glyoxylase-like metal-dependent hydrolase (beta-lactamase superfamily II)
MSGPVTAIPLPLAHVGSVNSWLLRGEPLALVDAGPGDEAALAALEDGLRREGLRVEDIELVLATHRHIDHIGLAATIQRRSAAVVAALGAVADYAERYHAELEQDRRFARALPSTAYGIAGHIWPARTVAEQPLLVVWEVLGHLELLLAADRVTERAQDGGSTFEHARGASRPRDGAARRQPRRREPAHVHGR